MMPECMLQNIAQPHRNATAGENISRRNTYTPPVRGIADDSSAQMLAPNHVNAPAATHTSSMPPNDGTARLTSDGCTKIDEPTIVPTTIAVACVSPIVRASFAVMRRRSPERLALLLYPIETLARKARAPHSRCSPGRLALLLHLIETLARKARAPHPRRSPGRLA